LGGNLPPNTQIVISGALKGIDCEELTAKFDASIVENQIAFTKPGIRQHQHYLTISRMMRSIPFRNK
jgi:hypothetical protein